MRQSRIKRGCLNSFTHRAVCDGNRAVCEIFRAVRERANSVLDSQKFYGGHLIYVKSISDGILVLTAQAQVVGTSKWTLLGGGGTGKGADFVYPLAGDSPVQLLVRVRLKKNNADYGQPSEPSLVTVNP